MIACATPSNMKVLIATLAFASKSSYTPKTHQNISPHRKNKNKRYPYPSSVTSPLPTLPSNPQTTKNTGQVIHPIMMMTMIALSLIVPFEERDVVCHLLQVVRCRCRDGLVADPRLRLDRLVCARFGDNLPPFLGTF